MAIKACRSAPSGLLSLALLLSLSLGFSPHVFANSSTAASAQAASPAPPSASAQSTDAEAAEAELLPKVVAGTPYSALIVHTRVDIEAQPAEPKAAGGPPEIPVGGDERHVYHARVLETFRGKAYRTIRYEAWVEIGEDVSLDSTPQIVTLCKGPHGFYWPGVGSSFSATPKLVADARRVGRQRPASRNFPECG